MKNVTIIIPIYNAEQFVKQCFENICSQTFQHSSIECIFVNDGSTDRSKILIKDYISSNKTSISFRLISHEHNRGVSAARNTGIDAAQNTYIYFLDADDTITPNCIKTLVDAIETYPDADVICGNLITKKNNLYHHDANKVFKTIGKIQNLHDTLLFIYASYSCNKLLSKDFILKHKLYFPEGIPFFEDLHWNIDMSIHSNVIVYIPQVTYIYEDVGTSAMSLSSHRKDIVARCWMSLIQKAQSLHEADCTIEKHLFIFFYTFQLLTTSHHLKLSEVKSVRKSLLRQSVSLRSPLLFLYDLQLYQPFLALSKLRCVRNRSAELRIWICDKLK